MSRSTATRGTGDMPSSLLSGLEAAGVVVADSDLARLSAQMPTPAPAGMESRARARRRRSARAARGPLRRLARGRVGRRILAALLDDPGTVSWMLHRLSNKAAAQASFEQRVAPTRIAGFEDCAWVFSSNPLNHGLARLELDEAAYLFRLVRSMGEPATVEIGRFRGGTTFLLAAAGARVISIDNDVARQSRFSVELAASLAGFGLRERVELVIADSRSYPAEPGRFDLVFIDGDHSYSGVRADFEHWWPTLAAGGHLVFHDAVFLPSDSRRAVCEGVVRFVEELEAKQMGERRPAPGTLAHFVKPRPTGN